MNPCCHHCDPDNERHRCPAFRGHMWPCHQCETERALAAFRLKYLGVA